MVNLTQEFKFINVSDYCSQIIKAGTNYCDFPLLDFAYYFLIPVIIILSLLILKQYKLKILEWFRIQKAKHNYIRIFLLQSSGNIKDIMIKLDNFNNFKFKKRTYNLDNLSNNVIGYITNVPVFFYDYKFIFPLRIVERKIDKELQIQLKIKETDKTKLTDKIKIFMLKIDSNILNMVYDKKLISDLYSISKGENEFKTKLLYIGGGIAILIFLYYTGLLNEILSYLGISI